MEKDTKFKKGNIPWHKGKKIDFNIYPNYGMKNKRHKKESIDKFIKTRIENNSFIAWNKGLKGSINSGSFKKGHKVLGNGIIKAIDKNRLNGVWNKGNKIDKIKYPNMGHNKPHKKETIERYIEKRKNWISPKNDTSIEIKIQNLLKELKIGFFTHIYMDEILNSYQCDIFIPVQRNKDRFIKQPIIIECDGDYWHKYPVGRDIDKIRTSELLEKGFKVLRLWENEIKVMDILELKNKLFHGGQRI